MKLIVKVGSVFKMGNWENDTYFEEDEIYEEEVKSLKEAEKKLKRQYNGIYHIYKNLNNDIIALVY